MNTIIEDILENDKLIYDQDSDYFEKFQKLSIDELKYIKEKIADNDGLDWGWILPYDTCKILFPERKQYILISEGVVRTIGDWVAIERIKKRNVKKYINFMSGKEKFTCEVSLIEITNSTKAYEELQNFLTLKDIIT